MLSGDRGLKGGVLAVGGREDDGIADDEMAGAMDDDGIEDAVDDGMLVEE